jgi:hypothetical protein
VRETLAAVLRPEDVGAVVAEDEGGEKEKRVLLEMAYKPRQTALMQMARDAGWETIPGLEVLSAQGWWQVRNDAFFLQFVTLVATPTHVLLHCFLPFGYEKRIRLTSAK